ncbi:methyltransferase fsa4 [Colletotrichum spaethianum]|uniref:Methyltransferase fsa4 n=1 Tax=Colletotrichum spaethianum TaxID=700344 RepID=A0AA37PI73_9PEZI|nr:methyltransferase fsa4 [Colletotrichum spaethianum]GKT52659.1 methyltransferase fsa4 [Colletotrichum spaethianum]
MDAFRSLENCHDLRQLATNLLGAITEYTLRGNMGQAQEASLQSRILSLTGNIRNLVAQPQDQWLLHIVQSNEMAAIKLFVHWHVFEHIPIEQSISYAQLSDKASVDLSLLMRVSRMLISTGVLGEAGPDRVVHTAKSKIFLHGNPYGDLDQVVMEYGLSGCDMIRYFESNGRNEPDGLSPSPFTFTKGMQGSDMWGIYNDQGKKEEFMRAMTALDRLAPIIGVYDFSWIAEASAKADNDRVLLVDVGGGSGHAVQAICGSIGLPLERCVLQDKEPVISRVEEHISKAMAADSTLLIAEHVVEWPPKPESTAMDMLMLAVGGKERTAMEWALLLRSGGLTLERIHRNPTSSHCIIRCSKATIVAGQDQLAIEA